MIPHVAIILLHHSGLDLTINCVKHLCDLNYPDTTLIVIDNASSQPCLDEVEQLWVGAKVVRVERNLGVAGGRNLGFKMARNFGAQWALCVDDDLMVEKDTLFELMQLIKTGGNVAAVGPKVYITEHPNTLLGATGKHYSIICYGRLLGSREVDYGQYDHLQESDWLPGMAVLYNLAVVEAIGGFDESLSPYGPEEQDWFLRARKAGYRVLFAPKARVWHPMTGLKRGIDIFRVENIICGSLIWIDKQPYKIIHCIARLFLLFNMGIRRLPEVVARGWTKAYYTALWKGIIKASQFKSYQ